MLDSIHSGAARSLMEHSESSSSKEYFLNIMRSLQHQLLALSRNIEEKEEGILEILSSALPTFLDNDDILLSMSTAKSEIAKINQKQSLTRRQLRFHTIIRSYFYPIANRAIDFAIVLFSSSSFTHAFSWTPVTRIANQLYTIMTQHDIKAESQIRIRSDDLHGITNQSLHEILSHLDLNRFAQKVFHELVESISATYYHSFNRVC